MTGRAWVVGWAAGGMALQACVVSPQPESVWGRPVTLTPPPAARAAPLAGELVAVSAESLWVASAAAIVSVPWSRVARVDVRLSEARGGAALGYAAGMGLLTGGALLAACSQVEDTECGAVLPAVLGLWLLVGAVAAASLDAHTKRTVRTAAGWEQLRAYARFPQGVPDSLPRRRPTSAGP